MAQIEPHVSHGTSSPVGPIIFGIVGLGIGLSFAQNLWGAISGAALGVLYAHLRSVRARLGALQQMLSALEAQSPDLASRPAEAAIARPSEPGIDASDGSAADPATGAPGPVPLEPRDEATDPSLEDAVAAAFAQRADPSPPLDPMTSSPSMTSTPTGPNSTEKLVHAVRSFFLSGNTLVRVGLLVLLVGLSLLAKYAADNALFPVEARLAFAALVGLGLVGLGFRLRDQRPGFGLSLQGGGVAALYLISFFAFKTYGLVPANLAFGLFVGLAIATAALAHLQRSEALLVIGSLGGFLAPILASTGEGNHVALFSYYLILNVSIAFVAWRQTWRIPALVAFVCTYGVATTWGVLRYEPLLLASTEPFVVAFMALFTAIAVLHAWHRPPHLRGLVDGTLVFGTPFISILLEGALVRDRELGLALAAAGFGLFYSGWAIFVWRVGSREIRPLAEAFIALAVGFATMAIPFAFDEALTTSVAWALEGAGLYWIGARQSRAFPRMAGLVLQGLSGLAFFGSIVIEHVDRSEFIPLANGRALSCLALAMAGIFVARQAFVAGGTLRSGEVRFTQLFGIWGLVWWTLGSLAEIDQFVAEEVQLNATLVWIAATAIVLELGSVRWRWEPGRLMALASLPGAALVMFAALDFMPHLLADGGWIAWPFVFATFYFLWERMGGAHARWLEAFRAGSLWLLAIVAACALSGLVGVGFELSNDWEVAAFGVGLAAVLLGCRSLHDGARSPFDRNSDSSLMLGLGPVAVFALLTIVVLQFAGRGDAAPLPHLPLLNPLDLVVWMLALSIWSWWRGAAPVIGDSLDTAQRRAGALVLVAIAFTSLNGLLARAVHQWTDVRFSPDSLWDSVAMQVTLSIAWTLVGLVGMLLSSRQRWRRAWMGFAALLAVVVVKLFTVDLSQLSTLARIGTFLAVGALLLVLGYFSPVPPGGPRREGTSLNAEPLGDPS